MIFDPKRLLPPGAKIKVIGVGGGGGNAVNTMIAAAWQAWSSSPATPTCRRWLLAAAARLQIGTQLTRGLGAGADPDVGRSALEDAHEIAGAPRGRRHGLHHRRHGRRHRHRRGLRRGRRSPANSAPSPSASSPSPSPSKATPRASRPTRHRRLGARRHAHHDPQPDACCRSSTPTR